MFFNGKLNIRLFVAVLFIASAAWGKDIPVTSLDTAKYVRPPIAPLAHKWNQEKNALSRWYPTFPITEEQFFSKASKLLGLKDDDSQIFLFNEKNNLSTSIHKRYRQTYKGLPIKNAELVINLNKAGKIVSVFNNLISIENLEVIPEYPADLAWETAIMGIDMDSLRAEPDSSLVIAIVGNEPRLVYQYLIAANQPMGDWEILSDAATGAVISRTDRRMFVTGTGNVFIPDPKTAINSDTLLDQGDANSAIPEECYAEVQLLSLNDEVGGIYYLSGPYVNTGPTQNRAAETSPEFIYLREDDRFEEVNVYYHIDNYQRYIQSLGFTYILNFSQSCDVNGTTDDNSWFSSFTGIITYGSGGVDDAEDADVILHEYGHAIQYDIHPGASGGHLGAMGEGFGDYIAGTYSLLINPDFHPHWVFTWDGHNEFWPGRVLNKPYHYPENAGGQIHDSGQLWSAGLMDVWYEVPDIDLWDAIVLQHHFYIGSGATMEDAANAILLADVEINFGDYREIIIEKFSERGFVNPDMFVPSIAHTPLVDTEDTLRTEFHIEAVITSDFTLDTTSLRLFWGLDGEITDTLMLDSVGVDTFAAVIPGPFADQTVNYFLCAADTFGGLAFSPENAPLETYSFYVGADTVPPAITLLDSIPNTIFVNSSQEVMIIIEDNVGIAEALFNYSPPSLGYLSIPMTHIGGDTFTAEFSWTDLNLGEPFYYYFSAVDSSVNGNFALSPEMSFERVTMIVFDNFENGSGNWTADSNWNIQNVRFHSAVSAFRDRNEDGIPLSDTLLLTIAEPLTPMGLTELYMEYWTLHFMIPQNDTGFVELNVDTVWNIMDTITGGTGEWEQRLIELTDYVENDSLYIRFRTLADTSWINPTLGWYIDDISFITAPIVDTDSVEVIVQEPTFTIVEINPNPGNAEFTFIFYIPSEGNVKASIYNILGQKVEVIADEVFPRGQSQLKWLSSSSSGIYFFEIEYASEVKMDKFLLIR